MESATVFGDAAAVRAEGAISHEAVGRLVTRYFVASTVVLLVAGALGMVMRQSQANLARISPSAFYAMMTAHGLGAFVAWGAFGVMGFSYWVFTSVGFEIRPFAYGLARVTWWAMVLGTAGIIGTTLIGDFGGSWVFLYPLPFHSAAQWGSTTTAIFLFSVLLAGVAIITWSVSVVAVATGPSNPAEGGWGSRLAVATGLGILMPKKFPTREPLNYAILPLTVIGIDMVIATLPLAVLLIEMIVQSFDPSVSVDPLLAKNILWFFGHPVVYLLLFPAVSLYYLLIPRYAKRPLVAGNAIAIGWLSAVVLNVVIWSHHIYLDYPNGSLQSTFNTISEPLTLSITLVSALSLYSLAATVWKSDFEWTPAAKFLAAGMVGWLTAGFSGIVNATITFDTQIHNTLWVVAHFHQMALLNIGVVIFAAAYAAVPELWKKQLYSQRLADWHLGLTLVGGYGMVIMWYAQGLTSAPRRWAVLPSRYDAETVTSLAFIVLIALGQLVFVWNMIQTARGKVRVRDELTLVRDEWQIAMLFSAAVLAFLPIAGVALERKSTSTTSSATAGAAGTTGAAGTAVAAVTPAQLAKGKSLFQQSCAPCHVLADAGASGTVGFNLDKLQPAEATVLKAIKIGGLGSGTMPPGIYSGAQAQAVASYVFSVAGKK